MKCENCDTPLNKLGFEKGKDSYFHTLARCHKALLAQLKAERALVDGLEDMWALLQVAEHAQEYEEIEKARERLEKLYEARKAAGGGPRCKLCGASRTHAQLFCGAACSARWEAGERP
jgi:hypothetical protein